MAMKDNQVLEEILVIVKALTKKVDEQQEEMLKLNERCMEQSLLIRSLTMEFKHVKSTPNDDVIMEKIERTLKSYAEVANQSQIEVLKAKEKKILANEENKNQGQPIASSLV
jgi:hypothetical protein